MLEDETGSTAAESTPQPPRRRSASRAAGPPPEVAAPIDVPQTAAAQPDPAAAPAEVAPESPKQTRRATRATAPAAEVAEGSEPKAPARTRRAPAKSTAKAAPTEETSPSTTEDTVAVDEAAEKPKRTRRTAQTTAPAEAAPEVSAQSETVASDGPVAEKAPTRRRSATRPAAAPEPVAETPVADGSDAGEKPAEDKPPTRRRTATRTAAPAGAAKGDSGDDVSAALDALTAEVASTKGQAATPETATAEPESGQRPSRRRRATRPAAPAAPSAGDASDGEEAAPEMDGIAAALKMAETEARSRRALVADPFSVTAENRQAHLDQLAHSIASGQDDEDDEDEDDTDDQDDTDDEDDSDDDSDDSDDDSDDSDDDSDDSDDESEDDSSDDDTQDSDGGDRSNRRRRRRGGRRRRRGGSSNRGDSQSDDSGDSEETDGSGDEGDSGTQKSEEDSSDDSGSDDDSDNGSGSGTTRRRRRRRRPGSDITDSSKSTGEDAITGIEGSTRMAAKRQRRQDNRAAGRRRAPILSEAEFLARRESVDRKLVIRQGEEYTQLAVVEDDILVEHYVDRDSAASLIGNVYLGKVQNVLPSMEAAFIDIGRGRNAVLYAGEVDWSGFEVSSADRKVEKVFKSGQAVLVQVTKDPVGAKGARLTGHISLPGRYVVYSPGGHLSGISRKLPDSERSRLREILGQVISDEESVIVRTAAEGAASEELVRDVNRLKTQWEIIEKKSKKGGAPASLYTEPDLTLRIVRDLFTEDFGKLVVQGNGGPEDSFAAISDYVSHVAPHLADRIEKFDTDEKGHDAFAEYRIDEQIAKALDRKVHLPSGGSLVIDRTEAMTVVDVNTGRFTGAGGNLEATVTSNNLEAAEELVRQLRLRDIGGIIVVDFIDMVLPSNRDLLLRRLVECLGRDRTRHQVAEVTSLGLVQLTRKKIGTGLAEAFTEECEHCHGDGYLRSEEPVTSQAPSDGGDRRHHGGGGGSGGGGGNRNRGGRGRRGGSSNHGHSGNGEKKSE